MEEHCIVIVSVVNKACAPSVNKEHLFPIKLGRECCFAAILCSSTVERLIPLASTYRPRSSGARMSVGAEPLRTASCFHVSTCPISYANLAQPGQARGSVASERGEPTTRLASSE
jgi:hypothetical protein